MTNQSRNGVSGASEPSRVVHNNVVHNNVPPPPPGEVALMAMYAGAVPVYDGQWGSLVKELTELMKEIEPLKKRGLNTTERYTYMTATDIIAALHPRLAARGLIITQREIGRMRAQGLLWITYATDIMHRDGGRIDNRCVTTGCCQYVARVQGGTKVDDKAANKCRVAAEKMALRDIFKLVSEEVSDDPDGDPADTSEAIRAESDRARQRPVSQSAPPAVQQTQPAPQPARPGTDRLAPAREPDRRQATPSRTQDASQRRAASPFDDEPPFEAPPPPDEPPGPTDPYEAYDVDRVSANELAERPIAERAPSEPHQPEPEPEEPFDESGGDDPQPRTEIDDFIDVLLNANTFEQAIAHWKSRLDFVRELTDAQWDRCAGEFSDRWNGRSVPV